MRAPLNSRDAVLSRPVHGQTGWNGLVFFITRDSMTSNCGDEFAEDEYFSIRIGTNR